MSEAGRVFLSALPEYRYELSPRWNLAVKSRGEGKGSPSLVLDSRPSLASVLGRPDFLSFAVKGFFRTFAGLCTLGVLCVHII